LATLLEWNEDSGHFRLGFISDIIIDKELLPACTVIGRIFCAMIGLKYYVLWVYEEYYIISVIISKYCTETICIIMYHM